MRILAIHDTGASGGHKDSFRSQLRFLKDNFRVVPLQMIVDSLRDGIETTNGEIALTFDDGLRDHLETAYPMLVELSLPATFYVCPGLIDRGEWIWSHDLRERLRMLSEGERAELLRCCQAPATTVEPAMDWMKSLSAKRLGEVRDLIRARTATFSPTEAQRGMYDMMTWEELRSLSPELITIGSHTLNHMILPGISGDALEIEIRDSRRVLEEKLGRSVEHFCYPNGDWSEAALAIVRDAYRSASTMRQGFICGDDSPHLLPRIEVPRTLHSLTWRL